MRSGRIMHQMGAVRESIAAYEHALAVAPGHTAALLGLAEAELGRARLAAGRGAPSAAIAAAEPAAEAATRSSLSTGTDAPKRTAVKLIGDAAMVVARGAGIRAWRSRPPARSATRSPRRLQTSAAAEHAARADSAAAAAARRARRAYARAIHLEPNAACAWRDLAGGRASRRATRARVAASCHRVGTSHRVGRNVATSPSGACAGRCGWTPPIRRRGRRSAPSPVPRVPTRRATSRARETALARAVALDPRCAPTRSAPVGSTCASRRPSVIPASEAFDLPRAAGARGSTTRAADPSDADAWVGTALLRLGARRRGRDRGRVPHGLRPRRRTRG